MSDHPLSRFHSWFEDARVAGEAQPEACALATASRGTPSVRMVLLKDASPKGFAFYTNYDSPKSQDLRKNPKAEMVFYWQKLFRQVRVFGEVVKVDRKTSQAYFATRPRESQIGAWASDQSTVIPDRATLDARVAETEARFAGREVPCPPNWGGYRIVPSRVEFWTGRSGRLHDREVYVRGKRGWILQRLAP